MRPYCNVTDSQNVAHFFCCFTWLWIFLYNQISLHLCRWLTPEVFESKVHLTANHLYTQTYTFILFSFSSRCFHGNTFKKTNPSSVNSKLLRWFDVEDHWKESGVCWSNYCTWFGEGKKISLGSPPLQDIKSLFTLCNKYYEPSNGLCCSL